MNSTENLYIIALEECAEMQQCITKILRFGKDNHHPDRHETNERELLKEYYQLQCIMNTLFDNGIIKDLSEDEIQTIKSLKKNSITKYAKLSQELGCIQST